MPLFVGAVMLTWGCKYLGLGREFEGKIVYKASLTGPNAEMLAPLLRDQQASFSAYHKGDYIRLEEPNRTVLVDYRQDSITFLSPSSRQYYKASLDKMRKDQKPLKNIQQIAEEREILGHVCTGYRVIGERGDTVIYWEAKDLGLSSKASQSYLLAPPGLDLKGVLLGLEVPIPGTPLRLVQEAEQIEPKELDESLFQVPTGYTRIED
ncbi:MAG: hypothetical protein KatS3mg026_0733 [Bacteroidia bacterium]|nr:MAG: hypothetical protein KatS3mg026_0733 [Bacteroidia bacterium]